MISMFYTGEEMAIRMAILYNGNMLASSIKDTDLLVGNGCLNGSRTHSFFLSFD
jgi:hypothetical protein